MRQRLRTFLPIFLIALMVQVLAPIGACWAAAFTISDPLRAIEICHSDPASASGQADQSSPHRAHDGTCALCCAAQATATFDAPQVIVVVTPYRDVARVSWCEHAVNVSRLDTGSSARARAPPPIS
jgi:hypothetical protein